MKDYSMFQRLQISTFGHVAVGEKTRECWKGPLMFYAFKCDKHGIVENYPQGHAQVLRCPKCQEKTS